MSLTPTGRSSDRVYATIHAAEVFHDYAPAIAHACAEATSGEVVVATVTRDHAFGGIDIVPIATLAREAPAEDGGWSLVFSGGADVAEVEERCLRVARLAFRRWEAMRRWTSKHRD